jgi:putative ABC transport system permease protein
MLPADSIEWVLRVLRTGRTRTLLTVTGIAIGIASVALLTAIGEGVRHYVMNEFSQFGTRIIAINPGKNVTGGMGGLLSSVRPLTVADADALRRLPAVEAVIPVVQGAGELEFEGLSRNVQVMGVSSEMPFAWNFRVAQGRFLPPVQTATRASPYVVLGYKVKQELFGDTPPLGKKVRLGGSSYRVIGVIEPKGDMLGFDLDDVVYIPADLALDLFNRESLMEINVIFAAGAEPVRLQTTIKKQLTERHGREDFTLTTQDQMLKSLDSILAVLTVAVGLLGSISLLVGAVGILTTLTTAVQERKSEIGLLMALGATRFNVMRLFLAEAVMLSLTGGMAGILVMLMVSLLVALTFPAFPLQPQLFFIASALLLAALIGLLAGAVPAWRAASLNPVDALRAE